MDINISHNTLEMSYNNQIQIATPGMEDIWLRENNELYPIDKQPYSRQKVQYDQNTLTSLRLRVQSDIRYRRPDLKLVCKIQNLRLNRRGMRGGKSSKHATGQLILLSNLSQNQCSNSTGL